MDDATIKFLTHELKEIRRDNKRILGYIEKQSISIPFTATQAAAYLGVSRSTISNYKRKGLLKPVVKHGLSGYLITDLDKLKQ